MFHVEHSSGKWKIENYFSGNLRCTIFRCNIHSYCRGGRPCPPASPRKQHQSLRSREGGGTAHAVTEGEITRVAGNVQHIDTPQPRRGGYHPPVSVRKQHQSLLCVKGSGAKQNVGAVLNDSPVDCQTRDVTEPQREGTALAVEELSPAPRTFKKVTYRTNNSSVTS